MDEAHKKAQATRERNQEVRAALYREQAQAIRAARKIGRASCRERV